MTLKCDAVFEGGGVKGIGLVGAVTAIEEAGYEFVNLAGTSAGAIVASLLAAGYTGGEIEQVLQTVNYKDFEDRNWLDRSASPARSPAPFSGTASTRGRFLKTGWVACSTAKGKTTFGDIRFDHPSQEKYTYRFQAIAFRHD